MMSVMPVMPVMPVMATEHSTFLYFHRELSQGTSNALEVFLGSLNTT
jgi:hypothetical protein